LSSKLGVGSSPKHLLLFRKIKKSYTTGLKNQKMAVKIYKSVFCKRSAATLHIVAHGHSGKAIKTKENFENKVLLQVKKICARFLGVVLYRAGRVRDS